LENCDTGGILGYCHTEEVLEKVFRRKEFFGFLEDSASLLRKP
jgi:hypothetical protein